MHTFILYKIYKCRHLSSFFPNPPNKIIFQILHPQEIINDKHKYKVTAPFRSICISADSSDDGKGEISGLSQAVRTCLPPGDTEITQNQQAHKSNCFQGYLTPHLGHILEIQTDQFTQYTAEKKTLQGNPRGASSKQSSFCFCWVNKDLPFVTVCTIFLSNFL